MEKLILEGYRCFARRQDVSLAPLTVLVGENSSGKSSFLAAARIAFDLLSLSRPVNFNEDPFLLGAYDTVATYRKGRAGRAKEFRIGSRFPSPRLRARLGQPASFRRQRGSVQNSVLAEGVFRESAAEPRLTQLIVRRGDCSIVVSAEDQYAEVTSHSGSQSWSQRYPVPEASTSRSPALVLRLFLEQLLSVVHSERARRFDRDVPPAEHAKRLWESFEWLDMGSPGPRPYAFAPIRSRPQRTYDPIKDTPDPEGQHIPFVLAQMLARDSSQAELLRDSLQEFGNASGLFGGLRIRPLGSRADPFQILVDLGGPTRNLIDVGYGVSQILPVIVEMLRSRFPRTFLVQQPEVHLHPRAQAALASLFARIVRERSCQVIVETHSDAFVDRIRSDIRRRVGLQPEQVQILYFEIERGVANISELRLDSEGNVTEAPPSYRQFFLEEERRLLLGE